jgi:hypothetical protein
MDRSGALPDRCVFCNADAEGFRRSHKLYWTPVWYRALTGAALASLVGFAFVSQGSIFLFAALAILALYASYFFVRTRIELELGLCRRHRRPHPLHLALIVVCCAPLAASAVMNVAGWPGALLMGFIGLGGLLLIAIGNVFVLGRPVSLRRLTADHAWLANTGKAFREALPETPR